MPDTPLPFPATPWVIKAQVPDEVYTDRLEFLEYFYRAARNATERLTTSTVLLGQRRMGKTEIFRRVVNRLFFEQDPQDPKVVVPVYYMFRDEKKDRFDFAVEYLENFIRYYVSFYTRQPEGILNEYNGDQLLSWIERSRHLYPFKGDLDALLGYYASMKRGDMPFPEQSALSIPRRISDIYDSTIAVFLDEFQNTRLPNSDFSVVGYMQDAVESNTCPHFVTGSAMSILAREILGRGSLYGRFRSKPIKELPTYWGTELVKQAAAKYKATIPEVMAPVVAERCGGNPFYITAVVQQAAEQNKVLNDEEAINHVLAVDISSGFIWGELFDQVTRWLERINEHGITKWVLYLSALEEDNEISLERIQRQLKEKEGKDVSLQVIREVLIRLSRGDLLEYREFGGWFHKVDDPILIEFLKVWGRIEVERQKPELVTSQLDDAYRKLGRRIYEYKGYLAEVFMSQILLSNQNRLKQPLPGRFFNSPSDIELPNLLHYLDHRNRLGSGRNGEIDILAAFSGETWICQSKWEKAKSGLAVIRHLLEQAKVVQAERDPISMRLWLFSHAGLTPEAERLAQEQRILWSNAEQLDALLIHLGLRTLPKLEETPSAPE